MQVREVIGGLSSLLQIIHSVTKVAKFLNEVRESYNNVALNTTLVARQLTTIRAAHSEEEGIHNVNATMIANSRNNIELPGNTQRSSAASQPSEGQN